MRLSRVLSAPTYGFDQPTGAAAHGRDVFVTNTAGDTITELSSPSGSKVQIVPNLDGYLPTPGPVTFGDGYVFTVSPPGGSPMVTQVVPGNPATAPWMICNTNGNYYFSNPEALVVHGTDLWVVNEGGPGSPTQGAGSLTEMNTDSGALLGTFGRPDGT